jgi:hypothetical protein
MAQKLEPGPDLPFTLPLKFVDLQKMEWRKGAQECIFFFCLWPQFTSAAHVPGCDLDT